MAGRAGTRQLGPLAAIVLGLVLAGSGGLATPAAAAACDPVPVSFQRVIDRATRIFVVTVASRAMDGTTPETYTLVVREALRGAVPDDVDLPTVVTIPAPVVNACGDLLDVGITTHLVLALDVPVVDGAEPLTVPWILRPDGSLSGGWDDGPDRWVDVDAFRAALAGEPFETPAPTARPSVGVVTGDETPLASIGIVVGVVLGVAVAAAVVWWARRGARPTYVRADRGDGPEGS
jgi:hypothetical protein